MPFQTKFVEKMFKFQGLLWEPVMAKDEIHGIHLYTVHGPFCLSCRVEIETQDSNNSNHGTCANCGREYQFEMPTEPARLLAHKVYLGKLRESYDVVSLDAPPGVIKATDENEQYWIEAKLGQKNGKLTAVVYIGEKKSGQSKKDYAQMFLDVDDEQIRFDRSNKIPQELLARLVAEFKTSTTEITSHK